jgi:hypothetical protein
MATIEEMMEELEKQKKLLALRLELSQIKDVKFGGQEPVVGSTAPGLKTPLEVNGLPLTTTNKMSQINIGISEIRRVGYESFVITQPEEIKKGSAIPAIEALAATKEGRAELKEIAIKLREDGTLKSFDTLPGRADLKKMEDKDIASLVAGVSKVIGDNVDMSPVAKNAKTNQPTIEKILEPAIKNRLIDADFSKSPPSLTALTTMEKWLETASPKQMETLKSAVDNGRTSGATIDAADSRISGDIVDRIADKNQEIKSLDTKTETIDQAFAEKLRLTSAGRLAEALSGLKDELKKTTSPAERNTVLRDSVPDYIEAMRPDETVKFAGVFKGVRGADVTVLAKVDKSEDGKLKIDPKGYEVRRDDLAMDPIDFFTKLDKKTRDALLDSVATVLTEDNARAGTAMSGKYDPVTILGEVAALKGKTDLEKVAVLVKAIEAVNTVGGDKAKADLKSAFSDQKCCVLEGSKFAPMQKMDDFLQGKDVTVGTFVVKYTGVKAAAAEDLAVAAVAMSADTSATRQRAHYQKKVEEVTVKGQTAIKDSVAEFNTALKMPTEGIASEDVEYKNPGISAAEKQAAQKVLEDIQPQLKAAAKKWTTKGSDTVLAAAGTEFITKLSAAMGGDLQKVGAAMEMLMTEGDGKGHKLDAKTAAIAVTRTNGTNYVVSSTATASMSEGQREAVVDAINGLASSKVLGEHATQATQIETSAGKLQDDAVARNDAANEALVEKRENAISAAFDKALKSGFVEKDTKISDATIRVAGEQIAGKVIDHLLKKGSIDIDQAADLIRNSGIDADKQANLVSYVQDPAKTELTHTLGIKEKDVEAREQKHAADQKKHEARGSGAEYFTKLAKEAENLGVAEAVVKGVQKQVNITGRGA